MILYMHGTVRINREKVGSDQSGEETYKFPITFVPLPLPTKRCDPLGTAG